MPSSKQSVTPAVTSLGIYVKKYHPQLATIFDQCELFHSLVTQISNQRGFTLIIPTDDEVKRMSDAMDDPDTIGETCMLVLAHVIRAAFQTPEDWARNVILDSRYPMQKLSATAVGNNIELKAPNGTTYATLTKETKIRFEFRKNLTVWTITRGTMRKEMDSPASDTEVRDLRTSARSRIRTPSAAEPGKKGRKTGGYELHHSHMNSARFQVAIAAENDFAVTAQMGNTKPTTPSFLAYVMSFARFMQSDNPDLFFQCILPLIRFRHSDFYAIFESHRELDNETDYLIPDDSIESWWKQYNAGTGYIDNVLTFRAQVDGWLKDAEKAEFSGVRPAIYANCRALIEQIDSVRTTISGDMQNDRVMNAVISAACDKYKNIAQTNSIKGIPNVFPPMLAEHYKAFPHLKIVQDEIAYITEPMFNSLWEAFNAQDYATLINMIGTSYHTPDEKVTYYLPLTGISRINQMTILGGSAFFNEIRAFINSTMFMWIPICEAIAKDYPISSSATHPMTQEQHEILYNTDEELRLRHRRLYSDMSARDSAMISAALNRITATNVSEEIRAQIQKIASEIRVVP